MIDLKQCSLGIELGSTRIKAVLVGDTCKPVAQGDFTWENRLENGIWTYTVPHMAQHDDRRGSRRVDLGVRVQHPAAVERSTPVPSHAEPRATPAAA